jgi:hypothetical protein
MSKPYFKPHPFFPAPWAPMLCASCGQGAFHELHK